MQALCLQAIYSFSSSDLVWANLNTDQKDLALNKPPGCQ